MESSFKTLSVVPKELVLCEQGQIKEVPVGECLGFHQINHGLTFCLILADGSKIGAYIAQNVDDPSRTLSSHSITHETIFTHLKKAINGRKVNKISIVGDFGGWNHKLIPAYTNPASSYEFFGMKNDKDKVSERIQHFMSNNANATLYDLEFDSKDELRQRDFIVHVVVQLEIYTASQASLDTSGNLVLSPSPSPSINNNVSPSVSPSILRTRTGSGSLKRSNTDENNNEQQEDLLECQITVEVAEEASKETIVVTLIHIDENLANGHLFYYDGRNELLLPECPYQILFTNQSV